MSRSIAIITVVSTVLRMLRFWVVGVGRRAGAARGIGQDRALRLEVHLAANDA